MRYLTKIFLKSVHSGSGINAYLTPQEIESLTNNKDNNVIFTFEVRGKDLFWDDIPSDNEFALTWINNIRDKEYL